MVVPARWCSSQPKIAECSVYPVPLLFRHSLIFGDDLPNTALFHISWLVINWTVNRRSLNTTCLTHLILTAVLLVEGISLLKSSFIYLRSSLNLLCHSEICVRNMMLSPCTCWSILKCVKRSLLQMDPKIPVYLFLKAQRWTTWKRGGLN